MSDKQKALEFLKEHEAEIRDLVENKFYRYIDILDKYEDQIFLQTWWIGEFCRTNKICALNNRSYHKLGDKNTSKNPEVRRKISESVKELWDKGVYNNSGQNNGMFDMKYMLNPNFIMIKNYREKLNFYQPELKCTRCGKDLSNEKNDIHHIDENHNNILLTNLERLCVPCHSLYHYKLNKQPYVTVEIQHELQYGHRLPDYDGKCYFNHGHRGLLTIRVRRRIDPETGFAIDFNELKPIIKEEIDDVLDHEYFNNYMENPTTENTVIWIWLKLSTRLKGIESISFAEGSKTCITLTKQDMNNAVIKGIYENEWIPERYRDALDHEFDLDTDLPKIDSLNEATISTYLDAENDWLWFYKMIMIENKLKELNEFTDKVNKIEKGDLDV